MPSPTPEIVERLHDAGPLLTLAVVLLAGLGLGAVARRVRLPAITGQILAGVAMGSAGLDLFGEEPLRALQPVTHFALGLMAATVGAHLELRRLRNAGKRLLLLVALEATVTPLIVFTALSTLAGTPPVLALLFATAAVATAPATIVALVRETRAKGVFVKTLVAAVALNNLACLFLFEVARSFAEVFPTSGAGLLHLLGGPARQLLLAALIGGAMGLVLEAVARTVLRSDVLATATILALVLTSGLADFLGVSPLLASLFLGLVQTNVSRTSERLIDAVFADFLPVILIVFFTLAGMHLSFEHLATAGAIALVLFLARFAGKLTAATLAMRWARATDKVRRYLGLALIPQAGVAVALVILVQDDPRLAQLPGYGELFGAAVLSVVTANEIVGPIFARLALARAGEVGKDRQRLLDFLQEESIVTGFRAANMEQAFEELVDLMVRAHHLSPEDRQPLLDSILERERRGSTCLGRGLSVPHGILPDDHPMVGVMAISREGLAFPTPDGQPVHCMVLLGTSRQESDRHLQVLAALARTVGLDPIFRAKLFGARTAAHASELLHGEESEGFNTFLDDLE